MFGAVVFGLLEWGATWPRVVEGVTPLFGDVGAAGGVTLDPFPGFDELFGYVAPAGEVGFAELVPDGAPCGEVLGFITVPFAPTQGVVLPGAVLPGKVLGGFVGAPGVLGEFEGFGLMGGTFPEPLFTGAQGGKPVGGWAPGLPVLGTLEPGVLGGWVLGVELPGAWFAGELGLRGAGVLGVVPCVLVVPF